MRTPQWRFEVPDLAFYENFKIENFQKMAADEGAWGHWGGGTAKTTQPAQGTVGRAAPLKFETASDFLKKFAIPFL